MFKAIRKFFEERNYHELESPIITDALPQERYLDVLQTNIELAGGKSKTAYLIPSTETFNKKILAAGLGEHFVITKVFRGLEEIGPNHSPEFTMLEWYHLDTDYFGIMRDCEELVLAMKEMLDYKFGREHTTTIIYQGQTIELAAPWDRISVPEALREFAGIELADIQTTKEFYQIAKAKGFSVSESDDWQTLFEIVFADKIEARFAKDKPTFVYNYPKILCPLTKENKTNPLVCEKVELYIAGKEIANGYTELLDASEQRKRFEIEQAARATLGRQPIKFDHDLVDALASGMPEVSGIGMGLDRLAMIFADAKYISEINYFPASEMFSTDD